MPSAPFSLRLDSDLRARLAAEAKRQDRSESYIAARAIESFIAAHEWEQARTDAALAEADAGQLVGAEAVNAWMDSWDTPQESPAPTAAPKRQPA